MALQQLSLLTLCLLLQMQQANLEMLQRGAGGASVPQQQQQQQQPQQQQPMEQQQQQPQQQPQQQQQQQQQPNSSPADMFNNLASMYGLPSAQHGGATVTTGGPADASAPMASGAQVLYRMSPRAGQPVRKIVLVNIRRCANLCNAPSAPLILAAINPIS